MMQSADSDVPRGSSKLRPSCSGTMKAWVWCFCPDLFPLPSAYHLFIVKVFPWKTSRKQLRCGFFFGGKKLVFHGDVYLNWTWNPCFLAIFEATKGPIWQISTGFTLPQSCCNIHHHHLWPSNSHLKHHGSPHVHEGQIAKVHPEPGFQRNLWRNDTCRKETLILDRLRPTSGYHEGYHQTNIMPSTLLARPEMFEPFQLPAFEKKKLVHSEVSQKRKVLQSGKLLKNPKLWR